MQYVVAEVERQVVGYAVASIVAEIAELQRIAVTESHRRCGLAGAMLEAIITRARAGLADRLLLEVGVLLKKTDGDWVPLAAGELPLRRSRPPMRGWRSRRERRICGGHARRRIYASGYP